MISFIDTGGIPEKYINHFEEALSLKSWEKEVSICILVGYFNFFCNRDVEWSTSKLLPYLTGRNKTHYVGAWEGIVYFSRQINKDTADIISSVYLKALKNIEWLEGEVKKGFLELFLTLLIYVVDKPTLKYIPEFYRNSSSGDWKMFIEIIELRLRNMDTSKKIDWWNAWLKHFLENRKYNKPLVLEEEENRAIMDLLPVLSELFDEAVDVVCKGKMATHLDETFWYDLADIHVARDHSSSMAKLLIKVLGNEEGPSYGTEYIKEILKEIDELD